MKKFKISNTLKLKYLKKKSIQLSENDLITFLKVLENPPEPNECLKAAMRAHQDMLKEKDFIHKPKKEFC